MKDECPPESPRRSNPSFQTMIKTVFAIAVLCSAGGMAQSCGSKTSTARRIEQALEHDIETGKRFLADSDLTGKQVRNALIEQAEGEKNYGSAMQSYLSTAKLPQDFKEAFLDHISAHLALARIEEKMAADLAANGGSTNLDPETVQVVRRWMAPFTDASHVIAETYDLVKRRAIQHGARLPEPTGD